MVRGKLEATLGYFFETDFGVSQQALTTGDLSQKTKTGASLYLGVGYEYDYISGGKITYKTQELLPLTQHNAISSNGRVVLNVGTNLIINDKTRLYLDLESTFAGKINKDIEANFGFRIGLGEKRIQSNPTQEQKAPLILQGEKEEEKQKERKEIKGEKEVKEGEKKEEKK